MQQDIRSHLYRIVPAEVFKIDECQRPIAAAQTIVEAKIGWNEAAPLAGEFAVKIKATVCRQRSRRCQAMRELRRERMLKEIKKCFVQRTYASQLGHTLADLAQNFPAGQACFRR